ncbi:MAG: hypothetical protein RSE41_06585 [Clostridia bacterium]
MKSQIKLCRVVYAKRSNNPENIIKLIKILDAIKRPLNEYNIAYDLIQTICENSKINEMSELECCYLLKYGYYLAKKELNNE